MKRRFCVLMVAIAASAASFAAQSALAAFPASNGKIAFDSQLPEDFDFDVYARSANGSTSNLTGSSDDDELNPAWSADGQRMAFYTFRNGSAEIWVVNADGSDETRLTDQATAPNSEPAWSPDGTKIAFTSERDGNAEIYTMNADGSGETRLTSDPASDGQPAWSPNGAKIAFTSERDGNAEIYAMNSDGSAPTRLTVNAAVDEDPNWSPNGLQMTFASLRDGNSEIYKMSAGGGAQVRLTINSAVDEHPAWSPDGVRIAWATQREACCGGQIYTMLTSGSGSAAITVSETGRDDDNPDWQPVSSGQIVVRLDSTPDDPQDFTFTTGGGLSPASFQLDDDLDPALSNTLTFANVTPGEGYSVAESVPAGWDQSTATCDDGSPIGNISVTPGETITCTFANQKRGSITVVKDAQPDDPQDFSFTAGGGLSPTSFQLDDDADPTLSNARTFANVTPGAGYSVAESVPAGWDQSSATCSDGSPVTNISVGPGETLTCTFANQKRGSITVVKDAQPDDPQDFSFTAGGGLSPTSFQLDDDSDPTLSNTRTFTNVAPGAGYSVAESVPAGWDQSSATCSDGSPIGNISVSVGETVTCTFVNQKRGSITVIKDSQPNDSQDFSFTAGGGLAPTSFQLDDDADPTLSNTRTFANVTPGAGYSVAESVPAGWDQSSATCSDGSPIGNISVSAGETVTCTFVNYKRGSIVVVKDSLPNDGQDFTFTASGGLSPTSFDLDDDNNPHLANSQTFSNVQARNGYSISEAIPTGWRQTSATCSNGSPVTNVDVHPGETVTCTFVNTKDGRVTAVKDAQPNDPQDFSFTAGGGLAPSSFQLDDDSDGTLSNTRTFTNVAPAGGYSLSESVPAGWDQSSATCSDGSPIGNINISPGETVTCTFVNQKRGSLTVIKDSQPNDSQDFSFTAGGGLSPASFQLDDDSDPTLSNTRTFTDLAPAGGYSLSESVPGAWFQSAATCSDGSPVTNISISPGESVTCTFVNQKRGSITVVKDAQPDDPQDFSFTAGGGLSPASFQLDDDSDPTLSNTRTLANVAPGAGYSVAESVPAGWDQSSATCDDGSPVTNISVSPGETLTCTFVNQKRGSITVVKDAQPDDPQDFSFTSGGGLSPASFQLDDDSDPTLSNSRTLANVVPGAGYSVAESVPAGWDQSSATCDDGSPVTNVSVSPAEAVTCTFVNTKHTSIVAVVDARPDDPQDFSFTSGGGLSPASFQLDDDADPTLASTRTFNGIAPGTYSLAQSVPSGWKRGTAYCDDGSSSDAIHVSLGETVTCLFVNLKQFYDTPAASSLSVSIVPDFRQTISPTQCQSRGGAPSDHDQPLALPACNPPALAPGTRAHLGAQTTGAAELALLPDDLTTPADEGDVSLAANVTDVRGGSATGADYDPNAGGDDATLIFRARITDTRNGPSETAPGTVVDLTIPTPIACASTPDPAVGAACSLSTTANAVTPGTIRGGSQMVLAVFRVRVNDSGANGVRGDSDDRSFAMQGIYVP